MVFQHENWKVTAVKAQHVEPWLKSMAYRVDTDRGSIVFAGDTGPHAPLVDFARSTDVFVANCWNHQEIMDNDGEGPGSTGTLDAARFARDSGADVLILTHTGPDLCTPDSQKKAIRDISDLFKGDVVFGEEGMKLDLWQRQSE